MVKPDQEPPINEVLVLEASHRPSELKLSHADQGQRYHGLVDLILKSLCPRGSSNYSEEFTAEESFWDK